MKRPVILVVNREPEKVIQQLEYGLNNRAELHGVTDGVEGLFMYQQLKPSMVIVDADLPDLNGMTIASAIKDNRERQTLVYLTGIEDLLENVKADRFMPYGLPYELFIAQVLSDFNKLSVQDQQDEDESWENAIIRQYDCLVPEIKREDTGGRFSVTRILSPYHYLSGDGFNYILQRPKNCLDEDDTARLYGYIFDCAGHDLYSYGQAANTWYILKLQMWQYQAGIYNSLDKMMSAVNDEIFGNFTDTTLIPALCFYLDFQAGKFKYCSAGIPALLVKYKEHPVRESISCRSYMLGYDQDSTWEEKEIDLKNVDEITIITDGLNDLLREKAEIEDEPVAFAKHDDISAIFIKF